MKTTNIIYIALALTCGLVTTVKAQNLYIANYGSGTIGEYGLDGSTVNASLISGLNGPEGVVISGNDLFVVCSGSANNGIIGEYTTSGATVNASLISGVGSNPSGIAISGNDIFVVANLIGDWTIGEYTTSGATVNASLLGAGNGGAGVIAISGNDMFVVNGSNGTIGEYTTSGQTVNSSLISGLYSPSGIAISGNDLFITGYNDVVNEYTTSGATLNPYGGYVVIDGADNPEGIAVSGSDLFVANEGNGTIGEYTTSGATVNASLISGLNIPLDVAIGPPSPPSFTGITVSGSGLNITAKNVTAGETYTLLESTNLALPMTQWTAVLTNTFSSSGNWSLSTKIVNGGSSVEFYVLKVP